MDQYDLSAQGSKDGLWDWDLVTNRIHFSSRWYSILGYDDEAPGNTPAQWFERIHPEDREQAEREIASYISDGSLQFSLQHRMLHKDGSFRWMMCRGVITRENNGTAVRIAGSHSDITPEKVVDSLTGLPNKLLLQSRLARSIETSRKHSNFLFALLALELERPHSTDGNLLVIAAARRLETCLRAEYSAAIPGREYLVARSGEDEFMVLLDGLETLDQASVTAERLLKVLSDPFDLDGSEVFLSASIGIALSATGYHDAEAAVRDADTALYRAKSLGKGRCEVFDTAILESTRSRVELENDLKLALERQEFRIVYQPIVNLSSREITGFEALLRWNHPGRGMVSPAEFIPIAENTGLIVPLGLWVLDHACRQLKAWKRNLDITRALSVSINLSASQFRQPSFVEDISNILRKIDLDANSLILELTEGGIMENPEAANRVLMQLRVMGARIAVDDFGTGYSSLSRICQFPLDYLKIDRLFIKNIENSKDTRDVLQTIITLADQLGLQVIAEGVETPGQLEAVRSLGAKFVQGFLFSRPVSSDQAEELLKTGFSLHEPANASAEVIQEGVSVLPVPIELSDERIIEDAGRKFTLSRNHFLIGAAAVILICMAGLLVRFKTADSAPAEKPQAAVSVPEVPAPIDTQAVIPEPLSVVRESAAVLEQKKAAPTAPVPKETSPLASPALPRSGTESRVSADQPAKTPDKTSPQAVADKKTEPSREAIYPVIHDHVIGNCRGVLKFTRDEISFMSEKGKCSFKLGYAQCSYGVNGGRLAVKSDSHTYRFKSAAATTKSENEILLDAMIQSISRLHK